MSRPPTDLQRQRRSSWALAKARYWLDGGLGRIFLAYKELCARSRAESVAERAVIALRLAGHQAAYAELTAEDARAIFLSAYADAVLERDKRAVERGENL